MRRRVLVILLVAVLLAGGLAVFWLATRPATSAPQPISLGDVGDATGFARALAARAFTFPADDGPHGASGKIVARVCSECRDSKKPGSSRALARLMHG